MAKPKQWTPRRVRSEDERGSGSSDFIQLSDGEKFLGYALFEADPAKNDPSYYEFMQHWNTATGRSVPCAGDDCPLCEDDNKPKDVANTLWLVTVDEKGNKLGKDGEGELRIFKANSLVIKQLTEMRSEDEPIKGILFRVTRLDDRGNYTLTPKTKKITAATVKELVKADNAPDFDQMVTSQLNKAMSGITTARALDDDDDDDNDEPTGGKKGGKSSSKSTGKGKKAAAEPDDDDNEWPDELDEVEVTVAKVEKEGNWIEVTNDDFEGKKKVWTTDDIEFDLSDLSKGDVVTVTTGEQDSDGEYILTTEPTTAEAEDEEESEDETPDDIEDWAVEVIKVSKAKGFIEVKDDEDEEATLYGTDDIEVDEWKKGDSAIVSAEWSADDECYYLSKLDEPEAEEAEADGDDPTLPEAIEDTECVIVSIDTENQTIDVKCDDPEIEFTLYFLDKGPASKVDLDDYDAGNTIIVTAEQDSQGDLVATAIPEVKEEKKKASGGKKGGKAAGKSSSKGAGKKGGKGKK